MTRTRERMASWAARGWIPIVGGLVGWSGYTLYRDLSGHLPALAAVGLAVLYLAACTALAALGLRLSHRGRG